MANVHFFESADYSLIGSNSDMVGELNLGHRELDKALQRAEEWLDEYCFDAVKVVNSVSGELICELTPDEDDYSRYGDCDDWDIEMGFDPYEGCYTYDC